MTTTTPEVKTPAWMADAASYRDDADTILSDLPDELTTDQGIAVAQVHATLAVGALLAGLIEQLEIIGDHLDDIRAGQV